MCVTFSEGEPGVYPFSQSLVSATRNLVFAQVQRELRTRTENEIGRTGMLVPIDEGHFLGWLVGTLGVKKALEVGTSTGYSALATAQVCSTSSNFYSRTPMLLRNWSRTFSHVWVPELL